MAHVDEQARNKAVELAAELVRHQVNRVRDCLDKAEALLEPSTITNPDEVTLLAAHSRHHKCGKDW